MYDLLYRLDIFVTFDLVLRHSLARHFIVTSFIWTSDLKVLTKREKPTILQKWNRTS